MMRTNCGKKYVKDSLDVDYDDALKDEMETLLTMITLRTTRKGKILIDLLRAAD